MLKFITGPLGKILGALVGIASILGGLALFGRSQKKQGRAEVEREQMEESLEAAEDKAGLDRELVDDAARRRLREKHYRD